MTRIAVFGSEGRMGRLVREEAGASVLACYDSHPPGLGPDIPLPAGTEAVIDFSLPSAWGDLDRILRGNVTALVTGTTGIGQAEEAMLLRWAEVRPVFRAANMSLGIYVLGRLLAEAAGLLGDGFDLEIVEFHHRGKMDSPSGTALSLLDIWRDSGGGASMVTGRSGAVGPRGSSETGMHSVRGGDVAGEHQLHLLGDGERLLLSHMATGRRTFALGALRAASFVSGREPGIYGMEDIAGAGITLA